MAKLSDIEENEIQKSENRVKAQGLREKLSQFETIFVAVRRMDYIPGKISEV